LIAASASKIKAPKQIGYRNFVDDTRRAVFKDDTGQFVLDDDGKRLLRLVAGLESKHVPAQSLLCRLPDTLVRCLVGVVRLLQSARRDEADGIDREGHELS
jgi:hypothetical protein